MHIPLRQVALFETYLTAPPDNTLSGGISAVWAGADKLKSLVVGTPRITFGPSAQAGLTYQLDNGGDGGYFVEYYGGHSFSYELVMYLSLRERSWLRALAGGVFSIAFETTRPTSPNKFGAVFAPFVLKKNSIDNGHAHLCKLASAAGPWPLYDVASLTLGGPAHLPGNCDSVGSVAGQEGFDYKMDFALG